MSSTGKFYMMFRGKRRPDLSPAEFKDYYVNKHMKLVKSLMGENAPKIHSKWFVAREPDKDAEGRYPAKLIGGTQADFDDFDAMALMEFDSKETMQKLFAVVSQPENAKLLAEDEEKFCVRSAFIGCEFDEPVVDHL